MDLIGNYDLETLLQHTEYAKGTIRCAYISLFDRDGNRLFSIQKKDIDKPVVFCNSLKYKDQNGEYVAAYLTKDALDLIDGYVKAGRTRTEHLENILNSDGRVYVREYNVLWSAMPLSDVPYEIEEETEEEEKKGSNAWMIIAGILLMLI